LIAQLDNLYIKTRMWKLWPRLVGYGFFEGRPITTKGRWINPLVFSFLALAKCFPFFRRVKKPIFIIGIGRSGTTVLGMVLSMHREVGYLNEPKAIWHSIYPFEDLIGNYCNFKANYRLTEKDVSSEHICKANRLFGAYLTTSLSSRMVDKYPELIFRVPFVKKLFPDAKFLFLARNGWDTCSSIENWSERFGTNQKQKTCDWWGVDNRKWKLLVEQLVPEHEDLKPHQQELYRFKNHRDMAALEWIISMREGLSLLKRYPNDVLRVNFEQLCRDSSECLQQISGFSDLSLHDKKFFEYAKQKLKPVPTKASFELHPTIRKPFVDTMLLLGY